MEGKKITVRFFYNGAFQRKSYVGGETHGITRVEAEEFSYTVLMEFVKDYLKFTEIGGVYIKEGNGIGWKLITNDKEVIELVDGQKDGDEICFYLDNIVDTEIEPAVQMQPHVVTRPRANLIQGSAKKPTSAKKPISAKKSVSTKKPISAKKTIETRKPQKRQYVTTHELQQKKGQQVSKITNKSPELGKRKNLSLAPDANPIKAGGSVRRKLDLQNNTSVGQSAAGDNDSSTELPPPPPLTKIELERIARIERNNKVLDELGLKRMVANMNVPTTQLKEKEKEKCREESDDYIPENEDEDDSDDTSKRINNVKKDKLVLGPQTRSRVSVAAISSTEKGATEGCPTTGKKITSSSRAKFLKPTCSKLLKQSNNSEPCGMLKNYLELRERQKQGIANLNPTTENVTQSNMENNMEEEIDATKVEASRRWRGRTKMTTVHARNREERPVIFLNTRGQPVGTSRKELSNFLGTLAKDNVSLTYINWRIVPAQLKEKMWDYTRDRYLIPENGRTWVDKTINSSWRVYKSRMKTRYYTKYNTDEERLANRPNTIPLEDFQLLLKYWGDESVQELALDNKAHRAAIADVHTLGPNSMAQVRENLKKGNPNLASPSDAEVYIESREREKGRTYKTNTVEMQKRMSDIKQKMASGEDVEALIGNGKSHGREWLKGRHGKCAGLASNNSAPTDPYLEDLTVKIRRELEVDLEAKVNRKVQDNMAMLLKKLGEANPDLNLDIGDYCATLSSDNDENATPLTVGTTS